MSILRLKKLTKVQSISIDNLNKNESFRIKR